MTDPLGSKLPSLNEGSVSKTTGFHDNPNRFQTSSTINKGNSGGPIFDQYGNLIGIVVAKLNTMGELKRSGFLPQDVNLGIKASRLFALMGWPGGGVLDTQDQDALSLEEIYQEMLPKTVYVLNLVRR